MIGTVCGAVKEGLPTHGSSGIQALQRTPRLRRRCESPRGGAPVHLDADPGSRDACRESPDPGDPDEGPEARGRNAMRNYTRGEFLGLSALIAGGAMLRGTPLGALAPSPSQQPQQRALDPDLIVINARVYTVDPARPTAEAFAVKDDRFIAVGSTSEIRNLATPRTRVIDAERMTITPGFIDTHCHQSG